MTEFFSLSRAEQRDALEVVATRSGRPPHLLEKDLWVVWSLRHLFASPYSDHLVFKGGTSLSKAYGAIRRFSEDIDLTYDIRAIASDLIGEAGEPLPPNRSQEKRWSKAIRARLSTWVAAEVLPSMQRELARQRLPARASAEGDKVFIAYEPLSGGTGYVLPIVMLEFGARCTGEPSHSRPIQCDAAMHLPEIAFPATTARVMRAERTFWEKATAIHVFCAQGQFRGSARFARHWHDLVRLDDAGLADAAIADRGLAHAVAQHKGIFFAEKFPDGAPIDYGLAVSGGLQLVPGDKALTALASDYQRMVDDGLLLDEGEPFERLLERCATIERKANELARNTDTLAEKAL